MGFNDGPLLSGWLEHKNRLLRRIACWEMAPYLWADQTPPDLIVRLNVTLETAKQRDPEMDLDYLRRRIKTVRSFQFRETAPVVEIDANQPLKAVLLESSRAIWHSL